jgi:hypothetical protein
MADDALPRKSIARFSEHVEDFTPQPEESKKIRGEVIAEYTSPPHLHALLFRSNPCSFH